MLSLRQVVQDTFGISDLSQGIRQRVWADFYDVYPTAFPFQDAQDRQSLKQTLEHWDTWPKASDFTEEPDYPNLKITPYSKNLQGVTHSEFYWVFSQRERTLTAWPVGTDLDSSSFSGYVIEATPTQLPSDYDHYGDSDAFYVPDVDQWLTLTAVEGTGVDNCLVFHSFDDPGPTPNPALGGWNFLGYWVITTPPQNKTKTDASWASFVRLRSLIVSSTFEASAIQFYTYSGEVSGGNLTMPQLTHLQQSKLTMKNSTLTLPITLTRIQGGMVSSNGRLYLSRDETIDDGGGIYGIDLVSGANLLYIPSAGGSKAFREMQGLTLWNVDPLNPPNVEGQLHLAVLHNNPPTPDAITYRHWRVNASVIPYL